MSEDFCYKFIVLSYWGTTSFFRDDSRGTRVDQVGLDRVEMGALLCLLRTLNTSNLPDTSAAENRHHSVDTPFCYGEILRRYYWRCKILTRFCD